MNKSLRPPPPIAAIVHCRRPPPPWSPPLSTIEDEETIGVARYWAPSAVRRTMMLFATTASPLLLHRAEAASRPIRRSSYGATRDQ